MSTNIWDAIVHTIPWYTNLGKGKVELLAAFISGNSAAKVVLEISFKEQ